MSAAIHVDISELKQAMDKAQFSKDEVLNILGAGASVVKTTQKLLVPVDTGATRASILDYYGDDYVEIGPSTEYAPYIEYGTSNPNYPIQPFIVPSATGKSLKLAIAAMHMAVYITLQRKGLA